MSRVYKKTPQPAKLLVFLAKPDSDVPKKSVVVYSPPISPPSSRLRPPVVNTLAALLPAKIKRRFLHPAGETESTDFVASQAADRRSVRESRGMKVRFVPPPLVAPTPRPWIFERPGALHADRW